EAPHDEGEDAEDVRVGGGHAMVALDTLLERIQGARTDVPEHDPEGRQDEPGTLRMMVLVVVSLSGSSGDRAASMTQTTRCVVAGRRGADRAHWDCTLRAFAGAVAATVELWSGTAGQCPNPCSEPLMAVS